MNTFDAVMAAENTEDFGNLTDQEREAWQTLVNTGLAWQLQGWFGRRASELLNEGEITQ